MSRESKSRSSVSSNILLTSIVQFEEKRFLEAARKTIMASVEEAGRRLEGEQFHGVKKDEEEE